ncbi:MAG: hypothetical protein ACRCUB_02610, partial [Plesiomonas shigelloides]
MANRLTAERVTEQGAELALELDAEQRTDLGAYSATERTPRLPYSYARRWQLLAVPNAENTHGLTLYHVHPLSRAVLLELRRGLDTPFALQHVDEAQLELLLEQTYQRDSSERRQ